MFVSLFLCPTKPFKKLFVKLLNLFYNSLAIDSEMCHIVYMQNSLLNIKILLNDELLKLSKIYNVQTLEIFGSYSRKEQNENSDVDLLVTFSITPSLLKFIALENHLSDLLGKKVDLVMKKSIKQRLRKQILKDSVRI